MKRTHFLWLAAVAVTFFLAGIVSGAAHFFYQIF